MQGKELKNIDLFAQTGGMRTHWAKSFDVKVTDGKLVILFYRPGTRNVPEINGIEVIPTR